MTALDNTRYCPMCEDAAKTIADQKRTIKVLNSCIGGEGSLTTDNITRVEELEQRVKVLTDVLLLMVDDSTPMSDCINAAKKALNQSPQQTAAQIERWHVEWMMKLPVMVYGDRLGTHLQQAYCVPDTGVPPWMTHMTKLVAIPPLPKESNSPETDLDEALRRQ